MNCPSCGKSLWFVKEICPFCKSSITSNVDPLVAPRSERRGKGGELWVTLKRCHDLAEADLLVARLESAGIKTFLPDEMVMQSNAWNLGPLGYVRLQVGEHDLETAQNLIATPDASAVSATPEEAVSENDNADTSETFFANAPLSDGMKIVAVLLPIFSCASLLPFLLARGGYLKQGCDRRAREWTNWYVASFIGWCIVFVFIIIRNQRV